MPSTATITAFYTFAANTKARASLVNANFDIFRGHILPVSPNTTTAINNTYDLGSSEYRWRTNYAQQIDLQSNTTTGNALTIVGETTSSTPAFNFMVNGTSIKKICGMSGATTSASVGQFAASGNISSSCVTTASTNISNSTCTISTIGRPVSIKLCRSLNQSSWFEFLIYSLSSATFVYGGKVSILRDGSTISTARFYVNYDSLFTSTSINYTSLTQEYSIDVQTFDFQNAGTYKYSLSFANRQTFHSMSLYNFYLAVYEI